MIGDESASRRGESTNTSRAASAPAMLSLRLGAVGYSLQGQRGNGYVPRHNEKGNSIPQVTDQTRPHSSRRGDGQSNNRAGRAAANAARPHLDLVVVYCTVSGSNKRERSAGCLALSGS